MDVVFLEHAQKRMKQRGITAPEVEFILNYPSSQLRSHDRYIVEGELNGRRIKVVYEMTKSYINVITVM